MDLGFTSVAAITVICYLVIEIIKTTALDRKWLPVISGVLGGAVGVVAMLVMPSFPASDYLNAIAVGIVSGLAATGANQVAKKLKSK
jgi:O-antigen/teichoic acid export membrane protein